ncbi:transposase [Bradyrhizobium sp. Gha]|uniref:transposase n=1 Tax=Bradyrhizobium sp. Gha TaxID=1855318 RepID=UPI000B887E92|nr:transposase [Bradyrhizobium sp. Gha]
MSDTFSTVEVITGGGGLRRSRSSWSSTRRCNRACRSASYVARRHGLSPSLVFRWRRLMSEGGEEAVRADENVVRRVRGPAAGGNGFETSNAC